MNYDQLPNFFIIGAAKSGTTTLFDVVGQHPDVFSAEKKEIKFFSRDERYTMGIDWYQNTFFKSAEKYPVRMEASPAYLTWGDKTAPRMKDVYQDQPFKIAAIFRDPVKRAYSHYWDRVRQGDEHLPFAEAMYQEEKRLKENWEMLHTDGNGLYGYFRAGCYATRLKPYLDLFPRENIYLMLQEDLINDFDNSMNKLLAFLGVDQSIKLKAVKRNAATEPRHQLIQNGLNVIKRTISGRVFRFVVPRKVRQWLRNDFFTKPIQYQPMEDDIKHYLYAQYHDEVKAFEAIIKRDLSHWYSG